MNWKTGKPEEDGQYLVIAQAKFKSDEGVKPGYIFIIANMWENGEWETLGNTDRWDVLRWRKLSDIALCLPAFVEGETLHYW